MNSVRRTPSVRFTLALAYSRRRRKKRYGLAEISFVTVAPNPIRRIHPPTGVQTLLPKKLRPAIKDGFQGLPGRMRSRAGGFRERKYYANDNDGEGNDEGCADSRLWRAGGAPI